MTNARQIWGAIRRPSTRWQTWMGAVIAVLAMGSLAACGKSPAVETKTKPQQPVAQQKTQPAPQPGTESAPQPEAIASKVLQPVREGDLMQVLDDAPWIADGPNGERQIYVLSAPWCAPCRQLYDTTGRMRDKVQFRWIEMDATDAAQENLVALAATTRTAEVLDAIYGSRKSIARRARGAASQCFGIPHLAGQKD